MWERNILVNEILKNVLYLVIKHFMNQTLKMTMERGTRTGVVIPLPPATPNENISHIGLVSIQVCVSRVLSGFYEYTQIFVNIY